MTSATNSELNPQDKNPKKNLMIWAKTHQEAVAVAGIFLILVCFGFPYYLYSREKSEADAGNVLNLGQMYFHASVDPQKGPYKSETEKFQQALQTFQRLTTDYRGTHAAKVALFYSAKCQFFLGQYSPAYSSFDSASRELKGGPLGEEASLGKILCLAAQNQVSQAITLAELFLKESPSSFIAPEVQLDLSDLYLKSKDSSKAIEILKKVVAGHSDTSWGKEAARRLEGMKS